MNSYYEPKSDKWYFSDDFAEEREIVEASGGRLLTLSESNKIGIDKLCQWSNVHQKPFINEDYHLTGVGYELGDPNVFSLYENYGDEILDIIIFFCNKYFSKGFYFASTDPSLCCVASFSHFTKNWLRAFSVVHMNTPFIIFDKSKDFFVLIDFDLPIQILGMRNNVIPVDLWNDSKKVLIDEWPDVKDKYQSYTNLDGIIDGVYKRAFEF